ncbi:MAG: PorT family protein [Rikenellaceae bacterium]|nr:PorT family protein [Rikenellaceae bacterium]MCL2692298.1 PorT family protein [Rikenellaceae bacterium]
MKKLYVIVLTVFATVSVRQAAAQHISYGIEAGGTISHSSWTFDGDEITKSVGGYTIGLTFGYEILDNTWLQSGVSIITKGGQYNINEPFSSDLPEIRRDRTEKYRPMYVQLPVNLAYNIGLARRTSIFVAAGGFVAQGIGGEYNSSLNYIDAPDWQDRNENRGAFKNGALRRFDAGVNVGAGLNHGNLVLRVGYDHSFLNIAKDRKTLGADEFRNRSVAIVAGLRFR